MCLALFVASSLFCLERKKEGDFTTDEPLNVRSDIVYDSDGQNPDGFFQVSFLGVEPWESKRDSGSHACNKVGVKCGVGRE